MAILKLYTDIQSEEQKEIARWWGEIEGMSFNDVSSFCESLSDNDPKIEIKLHSNGGSVNEGWSIYDRLRATGKEIHATIEGKAASMATVVMMAAPKKNRRSYENAEILIHNPYIITGGSFTADELARLEKEIRTDQEKILNLYVERCSEPDDSEEKRTALREELQAVMDENIYITPERALQLGLIGEIIPPASAKANSTNQNDREMKKKENKVEVKQSLLDKMLAKLGFKSMEDFEKKNVKTVDEYKFAMDLNTADGTILKVEREEGEPEVGDAASPDGEHVMPDGSTIVVTDGVIVEIKPAAGDGKDDNDDKKGDGDEDDDEVSQLQARIEELEAENEDLKKKLEAAEKNAKSTDDKRILNAVMMAGGVDKVLGKKHSNYKPQNRKQNKAAGKEEKKGYMEQQLEDLRSGKLKVINGRFVPTEK